MMIDGDNPCDLAYTQPDETAKPQVELASSIEYDERSFGRKFVWAAYESDVSAQPV
jgi:hypothetical protein